MVTSGFAEERVSFENTSNLLRGDHPVERSPGIGWNGVAWFDYDQDGKEDLFVARGFGQYNALFRNLGNDGFVDLAKQSGIASSSGSSGVAAADIDNDGYQDLFVTGARRSRRGGTTAAKLYLNQGDGTFTDVTSISGISGLRTMVNPAWGDIDRDGYLDLFIGGGEIAAQGNRLFLNKRNGTFADISSIANINVYDGNQLGFFSDYDNDGWPDLFVTRFGGSQTFTLWRNNHDYTFKDLSAEAGLNEVGAWMGWAPGDINNDSDIDLFVTNYGDANEFIGKRWPHALWINNGDGTYNNDTGNIATEHFEFGWGCTMQDFDNDGFLDVFFAGSDPFNKHVGPGWGNPGTLLINNGISDTGNDSIQTLFTKHNNALPIDLSSHYTTGVAAADYDGDGRSDIVVATETFNGFSSQPVLLRNLGTEGHWLAIRLEGRFGNRDAIGSRVEIHSGAGSQFREVYSGTSFLSMDTQQLHFGLGSQSRVDRVRVTWPSGHVQDLEDVEVDQVITLVESFPHLPTKSHVWKRSLPDTITAGHPVTLQATLSLQGYSADATALVDLSQLGGPNDFSLKSLGDGLYHLHSEFIADSENGITSIFLTVQDSEKNSEPRIALEPIVVLPSKDIVLFDEEFSTSWDFDFGSLRPEMDNERAFTGSRGLTVNSSLGFFKFAFKPNKPIKGLGYELRFAFHPGTVEFTTGTSLKLSFGKKSTLWEMQLLKPISIDNTGPGIDVSHKEWQEVAIPLSNFGADYRVESFGLSGFMRGIYHIDNLRLVALTPPQETSVTELKAAMIPSAFTLHQNAPNPFNNTTTIEFDLPRPSKLVTLDIFNIAGQCVTTLLRKQQAAGHYALYWDGHDNAGNPVGTGVYFYRLQTEKLSATRKLLLLR